MTLQIDVARLQARMNSRQSMPVPALKWLLDQLPECYWSKHPRYDGLGKKGIYAMTVHAAVEINCGEVGDVTLRPGDEISIFCDPRFVGKTRQIATIFCKEGTGRNVFQLSVYAHRVVQKYSTERGGRRTTRNLSAARALRL